ncbi:hypothetical protein O181_079808 [Austropuccinia psidii MF-1]|uniref:J domain-containing protein n=1 Tax=Austropuccinia psidii MF-1 TaxID=1389203 RepID=A0A9Q3FHH2_9BASI|nr:hypothetical protein [Austropuccinia psidii MF-1]
MKFLSNSRRICNKKLSHRRNLIESSNQALDQVACSIASIGLSDTGKLLISRIIIILSENLFNPLRQLLLPSLSKKTNSYRYSIMGKDYYSILGVPRSADDAEIKAAYKKAALRHHPDRNVQDPEAAGKKFKEISEAFQVLSDKNQKSIYDQFGEEGLKGGGPPPPGAGGPGMSSGFPGGTFHFSTSGGGPGSRSAFTPMEANDLFAKVFGMGASGTSSGMGSGAYDSFFSNMSTGARSSTGRRTNMNPFGSMDLDDDMIGGMPGGFGSGSSKANGHSAANIDKAPEDTIKPLNVSLEELYQGVVKRLKITRKLKDGSLAEKNCEVNVRPGWKAGTKIKFPGMGNEDRSGRAGAIVFEVAEKPHPRFVREGDDLVCTESISLVEALAGVSSTSLHRRNVQHLDGRRIEFKIPFPTSAGGKPIGPGQEIVVQGEGMPITRKGAGKTKGDLKIRIKVIFPTRVTPAQVDGVKRLFGV